MELSVINDMMGSTYNYPPPGKYKEWISLYTSGTIYLFYIIILYAVLLYCMLIVILFKITAYCTWGVLTPWQVRTTIFECFGYST